MTTIQRPTFDLSSAYASVASLGAAEATAAAVVDLASQQRRAAEDVRSGERKAAERAMNARLESLEDEASGSLAAGLVTSGAEAVSAGLSLGEGITADAGTLAGAAQPSADQALSTAARTLAGKATETASSARLWTNLGVAASKVGGAVATHSASSHGVDAKRHDFARETHLSHAADQAEAAKDARALAGKVLEHVQAIARARRDAELAAVRG